MLSALPMILSLMMLSAIAIVGAAVAADCVAGEYFFSGACVRCPIGAFQGLAGQLSCRSCPIGFTTVSLGGAIYTDCVCPAGSYKDSYNFCEPCPVGSSSLINSKFCSCPVTGHVTAGTRDIDCTLVLSCGSRHCCQLFPCLGKVKCWGENGKGQLGLGNTIQYGSSIGTVGANLPWVPIENVKGVSCNGDLTFFETEESGKKVYRSVGNNIASLLMGETTDANWGDAATRTLQNSPRISAATFAATTLLEVTATGNVNCALVWNGLTIPATGGRLLQRAELKCIAGNNHANGGAGTPGGNDALNLKTLKAVDFGNLYYPIELFRGNNEIGRCVRMQVGDIKCFGFNNYGQLGLGHTTHTGNSVSQMGNFLPFVNFGIGYVIDMSSNQFFRCVVMDNEAVRCCGYNHAGQLGQGVTTSFVAFAGGSARLAVNLGTHPPAKKVSVCQFTASVLFNDGTLKVWGSPTDGVTGYGNAPLRGQTAISMTLMPFLVFPDRVVHVVGLTFNSQCVMFQDGRVKCFGANLSGQLLQGNSINTNTEGVNVPFSNVGATVGCFRTNFVTVAEICEPCAPGSFADIINLDECKLCTPGTYMAATAAETCDLCPLHSYRVESGAEICVSCPSPLITVAKGSLRADQCIPGCNLGEGFVASSASCVSCTPGTYNDIGGGSACQNCHLNTYSNAAASSCTACHEFSNSPAGAAKCTCKGAYF